MILIIGGYAQGKKEYVKNAFHINDDCIFEGYLPTAGEFETIGDRRPVINALHRWIKKSMEEGGNPEEEIFSFVLHHPDCILICDEIGNGIVPMDAMEREYRERTGRILIAIAREAKEVERILCGIPLKIK